MSSFTFFPSNQHVRKQTNVFPSIESATAIGTKLLITDAVLFTSSLHLLQPTTAHISGSDGASPECLQIQRRIRRRDNWWSLRVRVVLDPPHFSPPHLQGPITYVLLEHT